MALVKIHRENGVKHVFIAAEGIGNLATVEILPGTAGERQIKMGTTGDEHLAAGVAIGAVNSGDLAFVITQGIVSGVTTAQAVQAGDRLTIAASGKVTPLNTVTPAGAISGYIPAGATGITSGIQTASGLVSGITTIDTPAQFSSGSIAGTAFNTGRVLGKALTSGLSGLGIQMLVCLE
jgi:hypothetical protein